MWLPTTDPDYRRAVNVQRELLATGVRVGWPSLLVGAVAERFCVPVLHHDLDYDLIRKVTGQPTEWVVPDGC